MAWDDPQNFNLTTQVNGLLSSLLGGIGGLFGGNQQTMAPAQLDPLQPASQPWGMAAAPSIAAGPQQMSLYQPQAGGIMGGGGGQGGMAGGGTSTYDPSNPNQIQMPNKPDPYLSAIAGASPILMEAMRLRAVRPPTYLSRTYNIPASQPMSVGATVQQPARRLSPLERYQMMLSGMR